MFGSFRGLKDESIDWSSLLSLLEDDDRRAAIERTYPSEGRESYLSALRRLDAKAMADLMSAGRKLQTAAKLAQWPTVAIAGMLNSGKTSLVATFLSRAGRLRTLRGSSNSEGTHRFVLWLPSAWRNDAELWGLLMARIGDAVGSPPEMLSDDPDQAHQQYNNRDGDGNALTVPLVATDTALDEAGIGLLDCPDIVSDADLQLGSPSERRVLLGRAATLCSAFLVVTSAESSRDATLGDLLRIAADLMPGVPRMLAVNKVRPKQTPDLVHETFSPLARAHGIETIYAAYDFEIPTSGPFIPRSGTSAAPALDPDADPMPVFFSVSEDADQNPPAAIADDRLLSAMPARLDRGALFEKFRLALQNSLRSEVWDNGFSRIDKDADASVGLTAKAQDCLLQTSLDFFAHRELGGDVTELRLHQSERIIRQLSESFAVTAPWYARWGVRLNSKMRRVFGGAGDFVRQLTPSAVAERAAGEIKDKFRRGEYGGLMTPERLLHAIDRYGGETSLKHWPAMTNPEDRQRWLEAAEAAILRFERDDFTSLDPRRLDEAVTKMWSEVPAHKKLAAGLTPLAATLAALAGVLMIPLDFGTTVIASASIPELFAALGLGAYATIWAGGQSTRSVGQQAARQQLADFHAVLCDTFGVARQTQMPSIKVRGLNEKLVASKIVTREAYGPTLALYRVRDEFQRELKNVLPRGGPSAK
ncbi:hypothetical protein K227x_27200 [Rubripirellula lacrimiformis]|uniref:Dynamin family protein n=1 Tax=Rubripirellula lacrimiformis TaxID=1930273 RepID=A0A517NB25_9BACT|nr:hypothetical protein [Rubripirellula lacrimiformis]QDT04330.1 hypothetical protein K227x_27200 [Rubripirellula lacrimiformis]